VSRQAQAVVLFLVGGAVLRASLTDLYLRYVRAGLRPLLLGVGVVLIVAAIATVWYEWRPARPTRESPSELAGRGHREPRIAWLLVLPLFALILVAPPALGSYAADRAGTALQPPPGFLPLPADDPLRLGVVDYAARAVYDHGNSLRDRRIKVTGFITIGPRGTPYLTRMILNCCAADAQPVKVGLIGQVPPVLQPDTWFEVIGTYTTKQIKDDVNGRPIPFITVIQARPVAAPHDQYES
jgi:putative membrane protein